MSRGDDDRDARVRHRARPELVYDDDIIHRPLGSNLESADDS